MISKHFNHKQRKVMNGPTAAVIRYDEDSGGGPQVVAHGKGHIANQIIELAKKKQHTNARRCHVSGKLARYGFRRQHSTTTLCGNGRNFIIN